MKKKKKKLSNFLKLGIVLFGISLLLWNCENEEVLKDENFAFNFKQAPLEYFTQVIPAIEEIEKVKLLNKASNQDDKIIIDKTDVLEISNDEGNSYTFKVLENELDCNNCFQNLVVSYPKNEKPIARIFTYYPDENYLRDRKTNPHVTFSGKWSMEKVEFNKELHSKSSFDPDCNRVAVVMCSWGNDHKANGTCYQSDHLYTLWIKVCSDTGGGGPSDFPIGIPDGAGVAGDNFGGGDDAFPTSPLDGAIVDENQLFIPEKIEVIVNCVDNLTTEEENWLRTPNSSKDIENINALWNNININGCTTNTKNFNREAIKALKNGAEVDFEEKVILEAVFVNETCLKAIYDKMGKASKFKEYLQNFEATASVADLTFTVDDNFKSNETPSYHNAMAITKPPLANNVIKIKFNTDTNTTGNILNKPDVFKAVSMIHEIIHAEMYRKMLDAVRATEISGNNLNWANWTSEQFYNDFLNSLQNKYSGIFYYFTKYKYGVPSANEPNAWQHQQMAQYYRDIVKQALTDFDPTLTDQQKNALSWIGLNTADIVAWQNLTPSERTAINSLQTQIKNTFPNGCN